MKNIITLLFVIIVEFPCFSQEIYSAKAASEAEAYINTHYPGAKHMEKEDLADGYYAASFVHNDRDVALVFDSKGKCIETKTQMTDDELPLFVYYMLNEDYKLEYASRIEKSSGEKYYLLEMKKKSKITEYVYDVEGNPTTDELLTSIL